MRSASLSARLARLSIRRPWVTVTVWVVVIAAAAGAFAAWGSSLKASDTFLSRPESKRAQELIAARIPGAAADTELVIVRSPGLTVKDAAFKARVDDVARRIQALGPQDIASVTTSYQAAAAARQLRDAAAAASARGPEPPPGRRRWSRSTARSGSRG